MVVLAVISLLLWHNMGRFAWVSLTSNRVKNWWIWLFIAPILVDLFSCDTENVSCTLFSMWRKGSRFLVIDYVGVVQNPRSVFGYFLWSKAGFFSQCLWKNLVLQCLLQTVSLKKWFFFLSNKYDISKIYRLMIAIVLQWDGM